MKTDSKPNKFNNKSKDIFKYLADDLIDTKGNSKELKVPALPIKSQPLEDIEFAYRVQLKKRDDEIIRLKNENEVLIKTALRLSERLELQKIQFEQAMNRHSAQKKLQNSQLERNLNK